MSGWTKLLTAKPGPEGFVSWSRMQRRARIAYWSQFAEGDRVEVYAIPPKGWNPGEGRWFPATITPTSASATQAGILLDKPIPWRGGMALREVRPGDIRPLNRR